MPSAPGPVLPLADLHPGSPGWTRDDGNEDDRSSGPVILVGDFGITGRLGRGGIGTVEKARDGTLGGRFVLKVLDPDLPDDPASVRRPRGVFRSGQTSGPAVRRDVPCDRMVDEDPDHSHTIAVIFMTPS